MGFKLVLIGFPIIVLVVSILLQGGNLQSADASQIAASEFCNPNVSCVSGSSSTRYTCESSFIIPSLAPECEILPNCVPNPPVPAHCAAWPFSILFPGTYLPSGQSVTISNSAVLSALNPASAIFAFGTIGQSGFIAMLVVAVGIVVLGGISIFGSGVNSESIRILFIISLLLGLWTFLTVFDGFVTGGSTSIFSYLNDIIISGSGGIGTMFYVLCTLMYTTGSIFIVSGGGE